MESLTKILSSMQIFYDKRIKTNKVAQTAGGFHTETLEKCYALMKALSLKNKELMKLGIAANQNDDIH